MNQTETTYVVDLDKCLSDRAPDVGGKAIGLGELMRHGLSVPPGFAITTSAYRESIAAAGGIGEEIRRLVDGAESHEAIREASKSIAALFEDSILGEDVARQIDAAYRRLAPDDDLPVAVRSSATAEDLPDASFAGQQDTYLWIQGAESVRRHVVRCWASLFSEQVLGYRARFDVASDDLAMGVVVQEMVPAEAAGVMMTIEPVKGDRSQIYIEAAFGLGEGVVRGDVGTDSYWVAKDDLDITQREINVKAQAHRFDNDGGKVRLVDVPEAEQTQPALSDGEVVAVAELGRRIEEAFGRPMDVEWAVGGDREVRLLQARPETVWSQKEPEPEIDPDAANVLNQKPQTSSWTIVNIGEAGFPVVPTPLSWTFSERPTELGIRGCFAAIGAFSRGFAETPSDVSKRAISVQQGNVALNVDIFRGAADGMPGSSGDDIEMAFFGAARPGVSSQPRRRRYLAVAARLPAAAISSRRAILSFEAPVDEWWRSVITNPSNATDVVAARALLRESQRRYAEIALPHMIVSLMAQGLFDKVTELCEAGGVGEIAGLLVPGGQEEGQWLGELYDAARGHGTIEQFLERHGYHGPLEGELSSPSWRMDPRPLVNLLEAYKSTDRENPKQVFARRLREGDEAEARLMATLSRPRRGMARALLRAARAYMPLRETGRATFLRTFDAARLAIDGIAQHLVGSGAIAEPADVYYLTLDEVTAATPPENARELVTARRALREHYRQVSLPNYWTGDATSLATIEAPEIDYGAEIAGRGVSPGTAEGTVRVVLDPGESAFQNDEILVCRSTDPSWASLFYLASAVVVDIGGAMSHGAIVARELGLPAVVNTQSGTKQLRTGDRVRVDGSAGTVTRLD